MSSETISIRPASPQDSDSITTLMREGVSDVVRRITIMGSPLPACYITDELTAKRGYEYMVGTRQG